MNLQQIIKACEDAAALLRAAVVDPQLAPRLASEAKQLIEDALRGWPEAV